MGKDSPAHDNAALFSTLQDAWRMWLRVRYPTLANLHADLVQETFADLLQWSLRRHAAHSREEIERVGFRILQRRVADVFRSATTRQHYAALSEPDVSMGIAAISNASGPEEIAEFEHVLKAILATLATFSRQERDLILRIGQTRPRNSASGLTVAERKRLSRLRRRMRRILADRYGIEPTPDP